MKQILSKFVPSPRARLAAAFLAARGHIIALALFLAVGIVALDDYGVIPDVLPYRIIGDSSLGYIMGDEDGLISEDHVYSEHLYPVAYEVALAAIERAPWVGEDSRRVVLSRHLATHLVFLAGGFFAWLLTYRLFGSRAVALIAMLLFLLHPRIYAQSFFNSKDVPFLCAFMAALYLIHRAFRRETVWAFALCGAGAGMAANVRAAGAMLFAAVLGALALDLVRALRSGNGAKRVLANAAAFSLAAALALYATFPILWSDPLNFVDALAEPARRPDYTRSLFRGEWVSWPNLPPSFIPVWALITTPPVALILAAGGLASAVLICARGWRSALSNTPERFWLLIIACAVLPVLAAAALSVNIFDDWRHLFFIYAPICILAALGLRSAASLLPKRAHRIGAHAAVLAALAVVVLQMAGLHPYQNDYFNALVNRNGADWLGSRYAMDYQGVSRREALEFLLESYPNDRIAVDDRNGSDPAVYARFNLWAIPKDDRERVAVNRVFPDFKISKSAESPIWTREIYGVTIASVSDVRADSQAAHRAAYEAALASHPLARPAGFGIYAGVDDLGGDTLLYVKAPCAESDVRGRFFLRAFPHRQDRLGDGARAGGLGYAALRFDFQNYGANYGGICVAEYPLPRYPVRSVETGQLGADGDTVLWSAEFPLDKHRAAYAETLSAEPVAESDFNIYADGRSLTYVKESCAESDIRGRFRLWAFPADAGDLRTASARAGLGYDSLNFDFHDYGLIFDGKCAITRTLPNHPMTHVEISQWTPEEGEIWSARINYAAGAERYMRTAAEMSERTPSIASDYDVYLEGGDRLIYVKSPCGENDIRGRFLLSVTPSDVADLSADSRERGLPHNPMNFDFDRYGVMSDGKCVIIRELPDYAIRRIETGQWVPGESGRLWDGEIGVSE